MFYEKFLFKDPNKEKLISNKFAIFKKLKIAKIFSNSKDLSMCNIITNNNDAMHRNIFTIMKILAIFIFLNRS